MTTSLTSSFSAVGSTTTARYGKGETVNFTLSGTYAATIYLDKSSTPDEASWVPVLGPFNTANATVAQSYTTPDADTRLRIRCSAYTSGTPVTAISDGVRSQVVRRDQDGNAASTMTDDEFLFDRGVRTGTTFGQGAPVSVGTATTVTAQTHAGRTLLLNSATGSAATLPAATGTGDRYRFWVSAVPSAGSHVVKVANSTDIIQGVAWVLSDNSAAVLAYVAGSTDDTITLNRSTTGAVSKGEFIEIEDIASGVFMARVMITETGTEATPFSSTV